MFNAFGVWGEEGDKRQEQVMDFSTAPARTEMVFNEIVKAASQKRTITYGEIARAVGLPAQFMANQLWFIRDACRDRGFPWLRHLAKIK